MPDSRRGRRGGSVCDGGASVAVEETDDAALADDDSRALVRAEDLSRVGDVSRLQSRLHRHKTLDQFAIPGQVLPSMGSDPPKRPACTCHHRPSLTITPSLSRLRHSFQFGSTGIHNARLGLPCLDVHFAILHPLLRIRWGSFAELIAEFFERWNR